MAGTNAEVPVAVIGGGVDAAAAAYALARRGVGALLLEAEDELARAASGTNSGILHTGFDSPPGQLETALIVRSAVLRDAVIDAAGVPVLRCGATLAPRDDEQARTVAALAAAARDGGFDVALGDDGALEVPGESVTDPVAYTRAIAGAAADGGAEIRTRARVEAIRGGAGTLTLALAGGDSVACRVAVNCAGLQADDVARMAGEDSFAISPRKGAGCTADDVAGRAGAAGLAISPGKGGFLAFEPPAAARWSASCCRSRP